MKILLLNPPRSPENNILKFAPGDAKPFIHRRLIGPPLGLLTIAASVKDFDVTLIDMKGEYDLQPGTPSLPIYTKQLLEQYSPDIVGVTVITSEFDFAAEIFRVSKEFNPTILTVAGGLHATLCISDFSDIDCDVAIPGQCPHIFRNLVMARANGQLIDSVPGIYFKSSSGFVRSKGIPGTWDSVNDDYLSPDRSLLTRWLDTYRVGNNPFPSTYVYTSLGCPFKCTFCSIWTQFRGRYYQRSVESLIHELKSIDEYPVVRFADANTVVDHRFINHLFDRIVEERIRKTFVMDIRADVAARHPDLIGKLAGAGLKVVICGFESFRDDELKKYRKEAPASENQDAIKVFEKYDIMVRGNYVIPNDYSLDDFSALAEYADNNRVVYAGYTVLTPMPGTVFYKQVRHEIVDHDYRKYNFFNSVMRTKLPNERFHEEIGKLWLIRKGTDVI